MTKAEIVLQTPTFRKAVKKLKPNQKKELDNAVKGLIENPTLGEKKKGNLAFLRVYKFKMNKQLTLLGYSFDDGRLILDLIRKDKAQTDQKAFNTLQAELQHAFSAPESSYIELSADDIISRNQPQ